MSLFKAEPAALQIVGDVQRLALKPGDRIVITYPGGVNAENRKLLSDSLTRFFEGHQVIVLADGAKVSVLEPST